MSCLVVIVYCFSSSWHGILVRPFLGGLTGIRSDSGNAGHWSTSHCLTPPISTTVGKDFFFYVKPQLAFLHMRHLLKKADNH